MKIFKMLTYAAFLALVSACEDKPSGRDSMSSAQAVEDDARYDQQLDKTDEQNARIEKQINIVDEQGKRYEILLGRWEKQADRMDRILEAQEKQRGLSQPRQ